MRSGGGEQPFKNLQAPPQKPRPVEQPPAAKQEVPAPSPEGAAPSPSAPSPAGAGAGAQECRIVKSRRRGGQPYLLQLGRWREADGKRVFEFQWEQGFDDRQQAERRQQEVDGIAAEGESKE